MAIGKDTPDRPRTTQRLRPGLIPANVLMPAERERGHDQRLQRHPAIRPGRHRSATTSRTAGSRSTSPGDRHRREDLRRGRGDHVTARRRSAPRTCSAPTSSSTRPSWTTTSSARAPRSTSSSAPSSSSWPPPPRSTSRSPPSATPSCPRAPARCNACRRLAGPYGPARRRPARPGGRAGRRAAAGGAATHHVRLGRRAAQPGHQQARLLGDQAAGRVVPGVEPLLEVGVHPALGGQAEVDRGRAEPPDVAHPRQHRGQHRAPGGPAGRRRSRSRWRPAPGRGRSRVEPVSRRPSRQAPPPRIAVHSSPVAALRTTAGHAHAVHLGGERHGVLRQPVEVVDGAVDRVDDPPHAGPARSARGSAPYSSPRTASSGPALAQRCDDLPLDRPVGGRHHVGGGALGADVGRRTPVGPVASGPARPPPAATSTATASSSPGPACRHRTSPIVPPRARSSQPARAAHDTR